ncbi:hypothetical protein NHQ30_007612 [Ciborinia camelliae]|nr:hypothetical protein NHQ30_007612 [Ciborinia camelliae]
MSNNIPLVAITADAKATATLDLRVLKTITPSVFILLDGSSLQAVVPAMTPSSISMPTTMASRASSQEIITGRESISFNTSITAIEGLSSASGTLSTDLYSLASMLSQSPPQQTSPPKLIKKSHKHMAATVASTLGGFSFLCALLAGLYFFFRRCRRRLRTSDDSNEQGSADLSLPEKDDGKDPVREMMGESKFGTPRLEIEGNCISELEEGSGGNSQEPFELSCSIYQKHSREPLQK